MYNLDAFLYCTMYRMEIAQHRNEPLQISQILEKKMAIREDTLKNFFLVVEPQHGNPPPPPKKNTNYFTILFFIAWKWSKRDKKCQ